MSRTMKCPEPGCPGVMTVDTDGRGGTVNRCPLCERRREWYAKHGPKPRPTACGICGGRIQLTNGRGGHYKYCEACRPLAHRSNISEQRKRRKRRESSVLPIDARRRA